MKKLLVLSAFLLAGLSFNSWADTGPYVEFNLGYSTTGSSTIDKSIDLVKQEDGHFGYNLNAGLMFLGFGGEIGYTRYADIQYHNAGSNAPADLYGLHLAFKSEHGFGPIFVMGKLGVGQLHRGEVSVNSVKEARTEKTGLYYGFGLGVTFMPTLSLVAQYQQILSSGDMPNAALTSLGINWTL